MNFSTSGDYLLGLINASLYVSSSVKGDVTSDNFTPMSKAADSMSADSMSGLGWRITGLHNSA